MDILVKINLTDGQTADIVLDTDVLLKAEAITQTEYELIKKVSKSKRAIELLTDEERLQYTAIQEKLYSTAKIYKEIKSSIFKKYTPQKLEKQIITVDPVTSKLIRLDKEAKIDLKENAPTFIGGSQALKGLTPYKNAVLMRIYSFWEKRKDAEDFSCFSLQELYQEIYGTRAKHDEQIAKLEEIVEYLKNCEIYLDIEINAENEKIIKKLEEKYKDCRKWKELQPLVQLKKYIGENNKGKKIVVYTMQEEPIVLTYAKQNKMLFDYDINVLAIKGERLTEDRVAIRDAIYRHIVTRKRGEHNHPLLLDKIIEYAIEESKTMTNQFTRYYDFAIKVLEHFKANGFIKDFELMQGYKASIDFEYTDKYYINQAKKIERIEKAKKKIDTQKNKKKGKGENTKEDNF